MLITGPIHHVALIVKDVEASRHFYCDVLGLQDVPRPASFKFAGAWFRAGAAEIHVIHEADASQAPGDASRQPQPGRDATRARHFCFQITDVDQALAAFKQHNIPVLIGPRPRGDGAIQTYVCDPDDHLVELVYLPPA
jgi:catechol 2,3-dioxygenase-like lactoylglutathione lyase family enzyme